MNTADTQNPTKVVITCNQSILIFVISIGVSAPAKMPFVTVSSELPTLLTLYVPRGQIGKKKNMTHPTA